MTTLANYLLEDINPSVKEKEIEINGSLADVFYRVLNEAYRDSPQEAKDKRNTISTESLVVPLLKEAILANSVGHIYTMKPLDYTSPTHIEKINFLSSEHGRNFILISSTTPLPEENYSLITQRRDEVEDRVLNNRGRVFRVVIE